MKCYRLRVSPLTRIEGLGLEGIERTFLLIYLFDNYKHIVERYLFFANMLLIKTFPI